MKHWNDLPNHLLNGGHNINNFKKNLKKHAYEYLLAFFTGIVLLVYKHPSFNIVHKLFIVYISVFVVVYFH